MTSLVSEAKLFSDSVTINNCHIYSADEILQKPPWG